MKLSTNKTPLEERMERIAAGYRAIEDKATLLVFEDGGLLPEEVIHRFEKGHAAFARERQALAELELATEERMRLAPSLKRLCSEAVAVAKRRYGDDPRKMATFGVTKASTSAPSAGGTPRVRARKRKPVAIPAGRHGNLAPQLVEEVVTTVVEEVLVDHEPRLRADSRPSRPCGKAHSRKR